MEWIALLAMVALLGYLAWQIRKNESVDKRHEKQNESLKDQIRAKQKKHREDVKRELENTSRKRVVGFLNSLSDEDQDR